MNEHYTIWCPFHKYILLPHLYKLCQEEGNARNSNDITIAKLNCCSSQSVTTTTPLFVYGGSYRCLIDKSPACPVVTDRGGDSTMVVKEGISFTIGQRTFTRTSMTLDFKENDIIYAIITSLGVDGHCESFTPQTMLQKFYFDYALHFNTGTSLVLIVTPNPVCQYNKSVTSKSTY